MTTLLDLSKRIYGKERGFAKQSVGSRGQLADVRHGIARSASEGGYVTVLMDGSEEPVEVVCEVPVAEGQRVTIMSRSGTYKVVSVGQIVEIAQNASEAAAKAVIATTDEYALSDSSSNAPAQGWSTDTPDWTPGSYIWRRVTTVYGDGTVETGSPALMTGNAGSAGEDATTLRIDSSRGTVFKNSDVSTVLNAVIYKGGLRITDIDALHAEFGSTAYLEWSWQRMDEDRFGVISSTDSRISQGGFAFTLSPEDVDTKVVFMCSLITD